MRKYANDIHVIPGAGGKGGPSRTNAIDKDACIHFIRSSIATPSITKFLLVSALSIRRNKASWFTDEGYKNMVRTNTEVLPTYYQAKLGADDVLTVLGSERKDFGWIDFRPGALTDEKETGKVAFGRTAAQGSVTRGDVAEVAVRLLEEEGVKGWFDLLNGDEEIGEAIKRVLREGVDSREGEDLEVMRASL